jgi:hypothetical protein
MKALSLGACLVGAVLLALTPAASTIYREAYPLEAVKRAALAVCAEVDPSFDRLIAGQRAKCYARQLQAPEMPQPAPRRIELADSRS